MLQHVPIMWFCVFELAAPGFQDYGYGNVRILKVATGRTKDQARGDSRGSGTNLPSPFSGNVYPRACGPQ